MVSAPLHKRTITRSREYFLFSDPKHPAALFRFRWSVLICCLGLSRQSGCWRASTGSGAAIFEIGLIWQNNYIEKTL